MSFLGFSQEDDGIDLEQNLKELIDGIVGDNPVFQKSKLTFYLNGEEVEDLSGIIVNLNDFQMKVIKKKNVKDGKKEEEIEIRIKSEPLNIL
jgi:hypothetical protein